MGRPEQRSQLREGLTGTAGDPSGGVPGRYYEPDYQLIGSDLAFRPRDEEGGLGGDPLQIQIRPQLCRDHRGLRVPSQGPELRDLLLRSEPLLLLIYNEIRHVYLKITFLPMIRKSLEPFCQITGFE